MPWAFGKEKNHQCFQLSASTFGGEASATCDDRCEHIYKKYDRDCLPVGTFPNKSGSTLLNRSNILRTMPFPEPQDQSTFTTPFTCTWISSWSVTMKKGRSSLNPRFGILGRYCGLLRRSVELFRITLQSFGIRSTHILTL